MLQLQLVLFDDIFFFQQLFLLPFKLLFTLLFFNIKKTLHQHCDSPMLTISLTTSRVSNLSFSTASVTSRMPREAHASQAGMMGFLPAFQSHCNEGCPLKPISTWVLPSLSHFTGLGESPMIPFKPPYPVPFPGFSSRTLYTNPLTF